ncbi:MAG: U32 family peptidase [Firmicutes bacterium]|nr:U32 family peptidase [Bacillota bacterium]
MPENMRRKPEILAPVGGSEQLKAAVRCGCDAVYFGLPDFNARRNADNFAGEGLEETIRYCHDAGVKVYVTVNTLVMDDELEAMHATVDTAARCGADAIIVQDLAVALYAKRCWPDLPLHASTQMAVCNAEGVRELLAYGFRRVVLARELTLQEIRDIIDETGADCEVFVHGAHCMSVSGNCYMSAMFGGRSGNRGLCAQPCRLDWKIRGKDHALSLKDMCYIPHMQDLWDAGVSSLKIEGRMKRPEYVAAAVTACRQALDGGEPDLETLRSVFSRSGFTNGYLTGKRTQDMFGYRTKEDVTAAESVLDGLARMYKEAPDVKVPVRFYFEAHAGQPAKLTAASGDDRAVVLGPEPALALKTGLSDEQVGRSLYKTGDTSYRVWKIRCSIDPGLFLPASALNAMRRDVLDILEKDRNRFYVRTKADTPAKVLPAYEPPARPQLRLRFETAEQICGVPEDAVVILPVKEIAKHPELAQRFGGRLWAELPPIVYGTAARDALEQALLTLPGPVQDAVCSNIGSIHLARKAGLRVHGGFELNVLNSEAAEEYRNMELEDVTVSPELAFAKMRKMKGGMPRGAILYGYLPLMKCRACPGKTAKGCGSCTGLSKMTDRTGTEFSLICRDRQYAEILNSVPLYVADRAVPKLDFEELYFTTESAEQCAAVLALYREKAPADFPRTAGLYFRELL